MSNSWRRWSRTVRTWMNWTRRAGRRFIRRSVGVRRSARHTYWSKAPATFTTRNKNRTTCIVLSGPRRRRGKCHTGGSARLPLSPLVTFRTFDRFHVTAIFRYYYLWQGQHRKIIRDVMFTRVRGPTTAIGGTPSAPYCEAVGVKGYSRQIADTTGNPADISCCEYHCYNFFLVWWCFKRTMMKRCRHQLIYVNGVVFDIHISTGASSSSWSAIVWIGAELTVNIALVADSKCRPDSDKTTFTRWTHPENCGTMEKLKNNLITDHCSQLFFVILRWILCWLFLSAMQTVSFTQVFQLKS